jgi:hypothetical protein
MPLVADMIQLRHDEGFFVFSFRTISQMKVMETQFPAINFCGYLTLILIQNGPQPLFSHGERSLLSC